MIIHEIMEQGGVDWHAIRRGIPTASAFDRIITPKTLALASGRNSYVDELIAAAAFPDTMSNKFKGTYWTERGQQIEPMAREWLAEHLGEPIEEVGFVTSDAGDIGFSPDGVIGLDVTNSTFCCGVEIKCEAPSTHVRYMREKHAGLPLDHRLQVHGSMAVSGVRDWVFCSYCPGWQPIVHHVKWDATTDIVSGLLMDFCAELAHWRSMLLPRLQPVEAS